MKSNVSIHVLQRSQMFDRFRKLLSISGTARGLTLFAEVDL